MTYDFILCAAGECKIEFYMIIISIDKLNIEVDSLSTSLVFYYE